jgi:outer membrane protein assembly factor BamB
MVLMALVAVAGVSGCGGDADPWAKVVHPDVLAKADLQYYWKAMVDLQGGERIARIYRMDENVYCVTNKNRMIAYDAQRGLLRWSRQLSEEGRVVFRPVHADRVLISAKPLRIEEMTEETKRQPMPAFPAVMVNTETRLFVINRLTGEVHREIKLSFPANTGGCTDGRSYMTASTRGWIYTIHLDEAVELPLFSPDVMVSAPLECRAGIVYAGAVDGNLYARRLTAGGSEEAWKRKLSGPIMPASTDSSLFQVTERGLFVPCVDNRLYALDPSTGVELWQLPFIAQGPIDAPVQLTRQTVFQYARRDSFYAINLGNGQARWSNPAAREVLSAADGAVYVRDASGNLLVIDEILGTVRQSLPMTGFDRFAANTTAPTIWVASSDGKLACISKTSLGRLRPEMLSAAAAAAPTTQPK